MRKARRVDDSIEFFSVKRAEESIARCDIAVLVLDAESGHYRTGQEDRRQDRRGTQSLHRRRQQMGPVDEVVRKAREEEIEAARKERAGYEANDHPRRIRRMGAGELFFLDYAPVIFTSAKSGFHLDRLLEAVRYVAAQLQQKIPTSMLNRTLQDAVERRQPVSARGHRLKFFYATQVRQLRRRFCCS